jgi:hypothetical protein
MVLLVILLVGVVVLFFIKNKKIQIFSIAFILLVPVVIFFPTALYAEQCAGIAQPADECSENLLQTWKCKLSSSCVTTDVRTKKFFSTGQVVSIDGTGGTKNKSAEIDVCATIANLNTGDDFYVVADAAGSAWMRSRFTIYKFKKGTADSKEFDPGGRKRNVQSSSYNGACKVTVVSQYRGADSNSEGAKVKIIEAGRITNDMCRSQYVTGDLFQSMGQLLDRSVCTNNQISETFIAG